MVMAKTLQRSGKAKHLFNGVEPSKPGVSQSRGSEELGSVLWKLEWATLYGAAEMKQRKGLFVLFLSKQVYRLSLLRCPLLLCGL